MGEQALAYRCYPDAGHAADYRPSYRKTKADDGFRRLQPDSSETERPRWALPFATFVAKALLTSCAAAVKTAELVLVDTERDLRDRKDDAQANSPSHTPIGKDRRSERSAAVLRAAAGSTAIGPSCGPGLD